MKAEVPAPRGVSAPDVKGATATAAKAPQGVHVQQHGGAGGTAAVPAGGRGRGRGRGRGKGKRAPSRKGKGNVWKPSLGELQSQRLLVRARLEQLGCGTQLDQLKEPPAGENSRAFLLKEMVSSALCVGRMGAC